MSTDDAERRARTAKSYRISRILLALLEAGHGVTADGLLEASQDERERVRLLAGVRTPTGAGEGVSEATWAEAVALADWARLRRG